jgi:hypothetical protein
MSEQQELKEFRQGDTVNLTVELRDENGISDALAAAFLLVDGNPDESDPRHRIELAGWPKGNPTRAELVLSAKLEQEPPGEYACYAVVGVNTHQAASRHEVDPPMRFRIVEHPDDIRQGPEVLAVGEFW